jgi:hypothetical protein
MTRAVVSVESWAGRSEHPVEIIAETPKRFRVRHLDSAFRWMRGDERYVPKYAVRDEDNPQERESP